MDRLVLPLVVAPIDLRIEQPLANQDHRLGVIPLAVWMHQLGLPVNALSRPCIQRQSIHLNELAICFEPCRLEVLLLLDLVAVAVLQSLTLALESLHRCFMLQLALG